MSDELVQTLQEIETDSRATVTDLDRAIEEYRKIIEMELWWSPYHWRALLRIPYLGWRRRRAIARWNWASKQLAKLGK